MHTRAREGTDGAWVALMSHMQGRIQSLSQDFVNRLHGSIPDYFSSAVPYEDLLDTAKDSLSLLVDCIYHGYSSDEMKRHATELGKRRAAQGIPEAALLSAVRSNFPVIWSGLREIADSHHELLLPKYVEHVWEIVDDYATACYMSYTAFRVEDARRTSSVRREFITTLFTKQGQVPETQSRFSKAFGVPIHDPYAILAVSGTRLDTFENIPLSPTFLSHTTATHRYLFWPLPQSDRSSWLPNSLKNKRGGLAISEAGLKGLASAADIAAALADVASDFDDGPLTVERHWPRLARTQLKLSGLDISDTLDKDLKQARPGEAERLRETVVTYLEIGRVGRTAECLFTHRNTIINRLQRFRELTGIDINIPSHSAKLVVSWM